MARTENTSPIQPPPAVPVDAVLKKLPLALERAAQPLPPDPGSEFLRSAAVHCPETVRPPPPLGPPGWEFSADLLNAFDRRNNDIAYAYASRLPGEPADGVDDVHFHPAEPRMLRVTVARRF